jgi:hypothetical protein
MATLPEPGPVAGTSSASEDQILQLARMLGQNQQLAIDLIAAGEIVPLPDLATYVRAGALAWATDKAGNFAVKVHKGFGPKARASVFVQPGEIVVSGNERRRR